MISYSFSYSLLTSDCIPSKALLQSSEHYEFARHHAAEHGVLYGDVSFDLARMLKRKDDVVAQNTKGVEFLFRKNKVTWAKGRGTLRPYGFPSLIRRRLDQMGGVFYNSSGANVMCPERPV